MTRSPQRPGSRGIDGDGVPVVLELASPASSRVARLTFESLAELLAAASTPPGLRRAPRRAISRASVREFEMLSV
jgi:hypothetical protein